LQDFYYYSHIQTSLYKNFTKLSYISTQKSRIEQSDALNSGSIPRDFKPLHDTLTHLFL